VWQSISDVKALAECIPGVELFGQDQSGDYRGAITFKTGPKSVRFEGSVKFKLDEVARSGELEAVGSDRRQASRAKAQLAFAVVERDGASELTLDGDVTFVGALAEFAESGGVYVGEQLMDAFAAELEQRMAGTEASSRAGAALPSEGSDPGVVGAPAVVGPQAAAPIRIKLFALIRTAIRGLWQRRRVTSTALSRGDKTADEGI
jgi:carbon monoxide dehydrogenase subunit G